ncbi:MAG: T9SS type A sorting domain-containing protein [Bacteroidota bacterium]|nr:T9SS type A sorting domain-containing protein [Bacteroidota bacterium]
MRKRYAITALVAALALIGMVVPALSQTTVTIGTGTSEREYPINTYWYYSVSEAIYTYSDLVAGGWSSSAGYYITNVRWYIGTTMGAAGGTLKIYLENTTASTLSSGTWSTTGTLVWSGNLPSLGTAGWLNFTLPVAFTYTGNNLLVRAYREDNTYYYPYAMFRYTSTSSYQHRCAAQDVTPPTSLTADYYRPNIQLVFAPTGPPSITINSGPVGCGSTANQTVTATITSPVGISQAVIWFRKNAGTWYWANRTSVSGSLYTFTINHATLGGVSAGDKVDWYVAAADNTTPTPVVATNPAGGSGTSPAPGSTPPSTFYSYAIPAAVPYSENFAGGQGSWIFGGTMYTDWRIGNPVGAIGPNPASAPNALCCQTTSGSYSNSLQAWAMFPPLDFTSLTQDPVLAFSHKFDWESSWDGGRVEYSLDGGTTWTTLGVMNDPNGMNWYNSSSVNSSNGQPVWSGSNTSTWMRSVRTLTGMAGKSCVMLRFYACSDGSVTYSGWVIDDIMIGILPQKDIEVVSAEVGYAPDRWAVVQNMPHTVSAVIKNNGWEAPPTSVTLVYKAGSMPTSVSDGVQQTFTPTWTNNQYTATFSTPWTPTATGQQTIYVRVFYSGDYVAANDSKSYLVNVQTNKVFGFEDFEGLTAGGVPSNFRKGWTVVNNGGASTWGVYIGGFNPNPNSQVAGYIDDATPDDWLISPPALLKAGSSYRIRFKYAGCQWGGNQTLKLYYGKTAVPAQMTLLHTWTVPNTGVLTDAIGPVGGVAPFFNTDPSGDANYYLAFQASPPSTGNGCIALDDIILDENPTPPPKIGYGAPGTAQGQHIDDPSIYMKILAIYKKPGLIQKTYEVVSTTYNYGAPGDFFWDVKTTTSWLKVTKATPDPPQYKIPNPYTPPRPRQNQTFLLEVDPTGFQPGKYYGTLTLYGTLYNAQYPNGIKATNEPFPVTVELTVIDVGSGVPGTPNSAKACFSNMTTSATPYVFADQTGLPFAAVTVTQGTIQNMCIEVFPNQLPSGIARYRYVQRYFVVTTSGTGWKADIDWYYTDAEAQAGGVLDPTKLYAIRQPTSGGAWQNPIPGVTSTPFPNLFYVHAAGYTPNTIGGNHCLVTNWTPKASAGVVPTVYNLGQNYPNPFNPSTAIDFSVPEECPVKLIVYNSLGDEVATLVDETLQAGSYSVRFDASNLPSGTYIYRMTAGTWSDTKRMLLAK